MDRTLFLHLHNHAHADKGRAIYKRLYTIVKFSLLHHSVDQELFWYAARCNNVTCNNDENWNVVFLLYKEAQHVKHLKPLQNKDWKASRELCLFFYAMSPTIIKLFTCVFLLINTLCSIQTHFVCYFS